jgi:predicted transcriptional regulator
MKKVPSLGEQELEILKYIESHSSISVREVASHFEREKNLARTTVLTVMERLRKKGFIIRIQTEGIFKYSSKIKSGDIMKSKISDFVEKTLGGSVGPLLNYFISSSNLTVEELQKLKNLAESLKAKEGIK